MSILSTFRTKKDTQTHVAQVQDSKLEKPHLKQGVVSMGDTFQLLVRPLGSEKAHALAKQSKYMFQVSREANKSEVAKAVEKVYKVHVQNVRVVAMPSKTRRTGRVQGRTSPWKKAIVTLREGESIRGLVEAV